MSKSVLALLSSLLLATVAFGADDLKLEATADSIHVDQAQFTTHLNGTARTTFAAAGLLRMSATRLAVNSSNGLATLEGSARVEFRGGEIQADSLTVTTRADGVCEVTGNSMRIIQSQVL